MRVEIGEAVLLTPEMVTAHANTLVAFSFFRLLCGESGRGPSKSKVTWRSWHFSPCLSYLPNVVRSTQMNSVMTFTLEKGKRTTPYIGSSEQLVSTT